MAGEDRPLRADAEVFVPLEEQENTSSVLDPNDVVLDSLPPLKPLFPSWLPPVLAHAFNHFGLTTTCMLPPPLILPALSHGEEGEYCLDPKRLWAGTSSSHKKLLTHDFRPSKPAPASPSAFAPTLSAHPPPGLSSSHQHQHPHLQTSKRSFRGSLLQWTASSDAVAGEAMMAKSVAASPVATWANQKPMVVRLQASLQGTGISTARWSSCQSSAGKGRGQQGQGQDQVGRTPGGSSGGSQHRQLSNWSSCTAREEAATLRLAKKATCTDPLPGQKLKPISEFDPDALLKLEDTLIKSLDREFEPFALQHNKRLLGMLCEALQIGSEGTNGLLLERELRRAVIDPVFFRKLGASAASAAFRLPAERLDSLGERHSSAYLRWEGNGKWSLKAPPECRLMRTLSRTLPRPRPTAATAPTVNVRLLSQAAAYEMEDGSQEGRQRALRLGTSMRHWACDVLCLQGVDPDLVLRSVGSWYNYCTSTLDPLKQDAMLSWEVSANPCPSCCVLWDRRKWDVRPRSCVQGRSCVSVMLRSLEDPSVEVRVATINPELGDLSMSSEELESWSSVVGSSCLGEEGREDPHILAAHFGRVGGQEAASLLPGLAGKHPFSTEAATKDVNAPRLGCQGPIRSCWQPSTVYTSGMTPNAWLEGHTQGYLSLLKEEDLRQRFPSGRPPLVFSLKL